MAASSPLPDNPGAIDPETLYRLDEAMGRLGWKYSAYMGAKRRGLKVHRSGRRVYVKGADLIEFITTSSSEEVDE
jgi:hypothetical protein